MVTGPSKATYHDMKAAMVDAVAEIDLRIDNRVQLS